jgi:hypothetical protein
MLVLVQHKADRREESLVINAATDDDHKGICQMSKSTNLAISVRTARCQSLPESWQRMERSRLCAAVYPLHHCRHYCMYQSNLESRFLITTVEYCCNFLVIIIVILGLHHVVIFII